MSLISHYEVWIDEKMLTLNKLYHENAQTSNPEEKSWDKIEKCICLKPYEEGKL